MRELEDGITRRTTAIKIFLILFVLWAALSASAQKTGSATIPRTLDMPTAANYLLPFDEDWSILADPVRRTDLWDPIKYLPLHKNEPKEYLSIGGEVRGAYEVIRNDNFTPVPYATNAFGTQRFQIYLDGHVTPTFRFFVQLESGEEEGREGGPRPIDLKRLDFLNAFIDLRFTANPTSPLFRIGRQELNYGSTRLVSVREGPNVRQSFYGVRVDENLSGWRLSSFAVRPAMDNFGCFDNVPVHSIEFWGLFTTRPLNPRGARSVDVYYYGLRQKNATYNRGTANELRHTFGGRLVSPEPSASARHSYVPHYDIEVAYQGGSFGRHRIQAWTLSSEFGYILYGYPLRPRLGLRTDISSGDGKRRSEPLGTFNPLFPRGDYFGVITGTGPGAVNYRDLHPDLLLTLPRKIALDASWFIDWRQSLHDGVYTIPGTLLIPSGASHSRFVGYRPGIDLHWQIDTHTYIQADYGVFYAGSFLRGEGHPHNLSYKSVWLGYTF